MNLKEELQARNLLYQTNDDQLFEIYEKGWQKFYCGYDPTADSLHLGHFLTFMAAVNYMKRWNTRYLLIGWATGFIWDPSGRDSSRAFLDENQLRHNQEWITNQVQHILKNLEEIAGCKFDFKVVNNYDFVKDMWIFDFFANIGKYITVNTMLTKESIRKRIEDPTLSITYTEFSYMLLQWYDFLHLFEEEWVKLQIWWSDQWWNMVTWTEMIRKKLWNDEKCYVQTIPLMLDSTGKKFWKSEWNAVWLDPNKNSPFFVYQFFMNTADADVERYMRAFTLLDISEIEEISKKHNEKPELRYWQQKLAEYLITTIFGKAAAQQAQKITEILFGNSDKLAIISQMSDDEKAALARETWSVKMIENEVRLLDLIVESGLASSNGEAKKMIQAGSIYFNEEKVEDVTKSIKTDDLINWVALLRKGKKAYKLILR